VGRRRLPDRVRLFATSALAAGMIAFSAWFLASRARASPTIPICQIQGSGETTPYAGQSVHTQGVVIADFDTQSERGFYLQEENCDANAATSDGIFVYIGQQSDVVSVGDWVEVEGTAQEFFGLTEISTTPAGVTVVSSGNPLPAPVNLNPPFDEAQSQNYFEAREGMYAQLADARVVGPTDGNGDTFVVRSDWGVTRLYRDDPAGTGAIIPVGSGGLFAITPHAKVGDQVLGLLGVLDYSFGLFRLQLLAAPSLVPAPAASLPPPNTLPLSFATLNLHNLFDTLDDPATEDSLPSAGEYQRQLEKLARTIHDGLGEPALIAVQEVENDTALQALVNRPELDVAYAFLWENGPDRRGIDLALLYDPERVVVLSAETRQGCTTLIDGLGPDGNLDVENPQNALTCDTDGDNVNDGNRLFSRPPLLAHVQLCDPACGGGGSTRQLWLVAVHLKSKSQDTDETEYTLPRRLEQTQFLAALYQEILAADPDAQVIVLGDFNDYLASQPLAVLADAGLVNLLLFVPREERYTFIYRGVSQTLDHVLVNPALLAAPGEGLFPSVIHLNADYPASWENDASIPNRASDHDPVLVEVRALPYGVWLPLVVK